jgi:hypothetical protein
VLLHPGMKVLSHFISQEWLHNLKDNERSQTYISVIFLHPFKFKDSIFWHCCAKILKEKNSYKNIHIKCLYFYLVGSIRNIFEEKCSYQNGNFS